MKLGDQPAYPHQEQERDKYGDAIEGRFYAHSGMTLREYYAGLAMQGLIASGDYQHVLIRKNDGSFDQAIPKAAIRIADALLSALEGGD